MGLTVYYDFRLPLAVSAGEVQVLLLRWRAFVVELGAGSVSALRPVKPADLFAQGTIIERMGPGRDDAYYDVPVTEGWQFTLQPAAGAQGG